MGRKGVCGCVVGAWRQETGKVLPCLAFARWRFTAFDDRAVFRGLWALDVCTEALVSSTPGGTRIPNLLIRSQRAFGDTIGHNPLNGLERENSETSCEGAVGAWWVHRGQQSRVRDQSYGLWPSRVGVADSRGSVVEHRA